MDNPSGGDPIIIAQVEPNGFWPTYVNAMCDAATRCFRMADELSAHLARGQQTETHIDRECARLGHELADADESGVQFCVHCGKGAR